MYPSGGGSGYYVLSIQRPSQQPESRSIDRQVVTIGRSAGDISLGDPLASGRHAEIYFQQGQVYVRDVGSTNGTYFNGMRMPEFALQPGQSFQCGQTILTLMGIYGGAPQQPQYANNPALAATVAAASPAQQGGYGAPQPAPAVPQPAYAPPQQGYTPSPQMYPPQGGYPQQQVYGGPSGYPPPPQGYGPQAPMPQMSPPPMQQGYGGGGYGQPMPPAGGGYGQPGSGLVPVGSSQPVPQHHGGQPQHMSPQQPMVGGVRVTLAVTGGELFGKLILGCILCGITFGIYVPWFIVGIQRYLQSRVTIGPTARGNVRLTFTGTGGQLFVTYLLHGFLTMITFGIYGPWFMCKVIRFFTDHTHAQSEDGNQIQLRFEATGGDLFVTLLVGYLLTMITLGIYFPWFFCSLQRLLYSKTKLCENSVPVGGFEFSGTGGRLLVTYLLGNLFYVGSMGLAFGIFWGLAHVNGLVAIIVVFPLMALAMALSMSWFYVQLMKFVACNSRVDFHGHRWVGDFTGKVMDLFLINVVGALLMPLTLGIYFFWFFAKQLRFQFSNLVFHQMS